MSGSLTPLTSTAFLNVRAGYGLTSSDCRTRVKMSAYSQCKGILLQKCLGLIVWWLVILCGVVGVPDDSMDFQKTLPVQVIWAVEGKDVELPCDVTPPTPRDSVSMILWFKDSIGIPLYSLDARGANLSEAHHLAVTNNELGSRSYFLTGSEPSHARLRIHGVRSSDEGVFRCRVDFSDSPTRNYKVNLTLVVQPSAPRVFDAQGQEVLHSSAGPFLQGHELFLSCQVTGGRPRPTVTWWQNGSLIDSVVDSTRDAHTTVNQLLISRVTRQMWGTKLECRASSHEAAGYRSREIGLNIYLMPQKVKISAPTELMSTRLPQLCRCETSGSYPPAKIVWLLGNKLIRNSSVTVSQTEDSTTSVLTLLPSPDDDGKELVCRADNPRFPGGHMQDSRVVRVAYPPKATVHFQAGSGATVVQGNATVPLLQEGGHVRLLCKTLAVPPAFKYTWYHNGHLVEFNETAGTLPSDHVLELRSLDRRSQGEYACAAGNVEGETLSEPLRLQIQYAPRCREGHETLFIGAIPHENLLVKCHVDASPAVVKFSWTYNNSRDVLPVQGANSMNNNGVISQLQFTPGGPSQGGLGTLACWASNVVGRQKTPCLFHLVPAKLPDPPRDCSIRKPCPLCVEVVCEAGADGGLAQSFVLEVNAVAPSVSLGGSGSTTLSDQARAPPVMRLQQAEPVFRVHALEPGREYQLAVYAQNARGRSDPPVQLANVRVASHQAVSDAVNEKPSDTPSSSIATEDDMLSSPAQHSLALILGALTAGACVVIVGIVAITVVILRRRRTPRSSPASARRHHDDNKPDLELRDCEAGFGEGFQRRSIEWRERNVRASLFLHDADASSRASQHITIGPDLILSPVSLSVARSLHDEEYLGLAGREALLRHPAPAATGLNYE